jgi:hypothetical protein
MTAKDPSSAGDEGLSLALLRAIAADTSDCFVDLPELPPDDVADLKKILRGERIPAPPVDRERAVAALARSERSVEASKILTCIVSSPEELLRVRAAAASYLSVMPPEAAEQGLLSNLTSDEPTVRLEVIKSLGCVGSVESLDRLKALPTPDGDHERQLLEFVKLVIAWRAGVGERAIGPAGTTLGVRWTTHNTNMIEGSEVQDSIRAMRGSTFGLVLNPDMAVELHCGSLTHTIFLNEVLRRGALLDPLRSRNMIAGIVALHEEGTRHLTVRYVVLTSPNDGGVAVIVARTSGDVVFAGAGRWEGDALRLTMRDVGLERIPIEIAGLASSDRLELTVRVWRGPVRAKRHGELIRTRFPGP